MKQKNVILMVVAIGCGLAAAVLTSQMSAKTPKAEEVEIMAAAKELTTEVKFTKDNLKDLVVKKRVSKNDLPPDPVMTPEELTDKTLNRTLRQGDMIRAADLGMVSGIDIPEGKRAAAVKIDARAVTPFLRPGARVDVVAAIQLQNRIESVLLLPNVFVIGVDIVTRPGDSVNGAVNMQFATLALDMKEVLLIRLAEKANADLSFALRRPKGDFKNDEEWSYDKVLAKLGAGPQQPGGSSGGDRRNNVEPTAPATVKVLVPTESLAANTAITDDLIRDKFKEQEFHLPLPETAVQDIHKFKGKYLTKEVHALQWVPQGVIGDKVEHAKAAPAEGDSTKGGADVPKPAAKAKPWAKHYTSVEGPSGRIRYLWEQNPETEKWVFRGKVTEDGTVVPVPLPGRTAPTPADAPPANNDKQPADPIT